MSRLYLIPPDYVGMREALERAYQEWSADSDQHLRGLLFSGQLKAWKVDESGVVQEVASDFWSGTDALKVMKSEEFRNAGSPKSTGRPVFRMEDLERALPSELQKILKATRARKGRAGSPDLTAAIARAEANPKDCGGVISPRRSKLPKTPRKRAPALRSAILEIASRKWPDGKMPVRKKERNQQIFDEWPPHETKPSTKTIDRAFDQN